MFDQKASQQICDLFNHLVTLGRKVVLGLPSAERVVGLVVIARCEKDMNGFASVFEQAFEAAEVDALIDGLRKLDEDNLADEFALGHELLNRHGFYDHRDLKRIAGAEELLDQMEENIGDRLWDLDVKMVALLEVENTGFDPERKK